MNLHDLIACPTCHARVDETCRTPSGHTTTEHGSRLVSRRCGCGMTLQPHRRYCDWCRDRLLQEGKNAYGRRRRAARQETSDGLVQGR